jgi:YesN/AraC family two-component response regulator
MPRVLVVDDDPGTRETFDVILRLAGFEVSIAATGRDALDVARQCGADLILADLRLPDITGVDVLKALRAEQVEVPVVIMTAFGSIRSAVEALKLGAADYVEKPIDDVALVDLVRRSAPTIRSQRGFARICEPVHSPLVSAARVFIQQHYADSLTYESIGEAVGRTPEYLERQFRQECGMTLHNYVIHIRLTKAYELAQAGQKIESLAASVGFGSKAGFFRAFHRKFGCTPGEAARRRKTQQ